MHHRTASERDSDRNGTAVKGVIEWRILLGLLVALGTSMMGWRLYANDEASFYLDSVSATVGDNKKVSYRLEGRYWPHNIEQNTFFDITGQVDYDPTTGSVNEVLHTREGGLMSSIGRGCLWDPLLTQVPCASGGQSASFSGSNINFAIAGPITLNMWPISSDANAAKVKVAFDKAFVAKFEADRKEAERIAAELTNLKKQDASLNPLHAQASGAATYVLKTPTPAPFLTSATTAKSDSPARYALAAATPRPPYGAAYNPSGPPPSLKTNGTAFVSVTVQNLSSQTWPAGGAFRLASHWYRGGAEIVHEGARTLLPAAVAPGASVTLAAKVTAPSSAGAATLKWDMVQESVAWFSDKGVPPSVAQNVNVTQ